MATGGGKAGAGKERPTGWVAAVFDTCPSFSDRRGLSGESICIDFSVFARNAVRIETADFPMPYRILWISVVLPTTGGGLIPKWVRKYSFARGEGDQRRAIGSASPVPWGNLDLELSRDLKHRRRGDPGGLSVGRGSTTGRLGDPRESREEAAPQPLNRGA